MLDKALNLTARLKQPLAPFETPLAPWFEELIEPIYDDGEQVVQDHTSRYLELIVQLHAHRDVGQVIEWLEAQRAEQLSLRLAVRMLEMQEDVTPCQLGEAVSNKYGAFSSVYSTSWPRRRSSNPCRLSTAV
jgi:hypothetical protein